MFEGSHKLPFPGFAIFNITRIIKQILEYYIELLFLRFVMSVLYAKNYINRAVTFFFMKSTLYVHIVMILLL